MNTLQWILETKGTTVCKTTPDASVLDAVEQMCDARVGALLVTDGDRAVGILSRRDVLERVVLRRIDPATTAVAEVMTTELVSVEPSDEPERVIALMTERHLRHLPVVDHGHVVGMLSSGDLARWESRQYEEELRMMSDFISGKYPG